MSVQALSWVLDDVRGLKPAERLVLLSIANHADRDGGNSWPSIATIASEADINVKSVKRALKMLVQAGLLTVGVQRGGTADTRPDRRPNLYTLHMNGGDILYPPLAPTGGTSCTPRDDERGGHPVHHGGDILYPLTRDEPSKVYLSEIQLFVEETSLTENKSNNDNDPLRDFDRFWEAYPRRVSVGAARKAWAKAIKDGADSAAVIDGAKKYASSRAGTDPKFTAHASTWLNGQRWLDEAEETRSDAEILNESRRRRP